MDEQQIALLKQILTASHWTEADKIRLRQYLDQEDPELLRTVAFALFHTDSETPPSLLSNEESTKLLLELRRKLGLEASKPTTVSRFRVSRYYYIAALFIVALATALYFYRSEAIVHRKAILVNEIGPGGNRATLTLADGTTVALDTAQRGIIIGDENIKYNNGEIVKNVILPVPGADPGTAVEGSLPTSLTLTTPKGGQYQIILSDGTKVWLNAASTLKYPSRFSGNTREVFLEGEGYFEVNNKMAEIHSTPLRSAQDDGRALVPTAGARVPFIVKSRNQEILVLGTSFNVAAYADEANERTTLITGKVQVRSQNLKLKTYNVQLLAPNQQAIVESDSLTVSHVDVSRETAWRNGKFSFDGKTFTQVMDELSRWYNLEVVYTNGVPNERFFGSAFRNANLSSLLNILKSDNVDYRMENGHTLIIKNLKPERKKPM